MLLHKCIAAFYFALFVTIAYPQSFQFTQYTTHNGLPIDNVYAAAQDEYGFMWFGTDFGISKFDGYRFQNYYQQNGMANKAVTDIVYAGGDSCLFVSYPDVIQSIHTNGKINTIAKIESFSIQQLVKHGDEYFFYARGYNKAGVLKRDKVKYFDPESVFNTKGIVIYSIADFDKAGVGFCTNKGLYVLTDKGYRHYLQNEKVDFAVLNDDNTIIAVSNNTVTVAHKNFTFTKTNHILPKQVFVYHMMATKDGAVWFRGINQGIYRLQNDKLEEMSVALNLSSRIVHEFFEDNQNNLWFCTDGSGVLYKRNNAFVIYGTQEGLVNNKINQLMKEGDNIYIGTSNGVSKINNGSISNVQLPFLKTALAYVYKLLPARFGSPGICITNTFNFTANLWIKSVQLNGKPFTAYNGFTAYQQDKDLHWVISGRDLCLIKKDSLVTKYKLGDSGIRKAYDIFIDDGIVWAGTDKGIAQIINSELKLTDSIDGKKIGQVFQFIKKGKDSIIIATENGLLCKTGNRLHYMFTSTSSYGSNYCRAICLDNKGKIWAATWDGIFETDGLTTTHYGTANGLSSKTCNAILYDSSSNKIYFGTNNGLCVIDKDKLSIDSSFSKVYIECTTPDTKQIQNNANLQPSQNKLHFYFNVPYYNGIADVVYEYKVDNGNWTKTAIPLINLSDISSGKHTIYVRATINSTVITKEVSTFSFTIKTPFYKTWWFWLLAALTIQSLIIWAVNKYNRKVREQKLAAQKMQTELASLKQQAFTSLMNPHFIFNALNSIQFYINKQDRQTANKYLSDFATLVRRSFDASQKTFVLLDEELETVRLYLQLEKMRFADKFNYTITLNKAAAEEEWMLPGMVLQPFLENAVLHGLAPLSSNGLLQIDIKGENNALHITIADNGIGIEKSKQLRQTKKHNSRGMQLIKERLEILSSQAQQPVTLIIGENNTGADNPGTKVTLVIPQEVYNNQKKI